MRSLFNINNNNNKRTISNMEYNTQSNYKGANCHVPPNTVTPCHGLPTASHIPVFKIISVLVSTQFGLNHLSFSYYTCESKTSRPYSYA